MHQGPLRTLPHPVSLLQGSGCRAARILSRKRAGKFQSLVIECVSLSELCRYLSQLIGRNLGCGPTVLSVPTRRGHPGTASSTSDSIALWGCTVRHHHCTGRKVSRKVVWLASHWPANYQPSGGKNPGFSSPLNFSSTSPCGLISCNDCFPFI